MTDKNFGAGVSGYLEPEGRSWETAVHQAAKPILDKELNLSQDLSQLSNRSFQRLTAPSGWISKDFLGSSDPRLFLEPSVIPNELKLRDFTALVNGWLLDVRYTNETGNEASAVDRNIIDVGAGPIGAGAKRSDLVVLEVWRKLVSASPDIDGKSASQKIWRDGNTKVHLNEDAALNLADDLLDVMVGSETTKRVQVQYRLRLIQGVDVLAFPFGLDDPTLTTRSVPTAWDLPNGDPSLFTYSNLSDEGDPGLWRAGDGNPANGLGSVDGYIYAIPLCAVFRRNRTAFARNSNHNGAISVLAGPSDRPDGLYHDAIVAADLLDLRTGTSLTGWNYPEVLQKNFNFLLDNSLQTEVTETTMGGGVRGPTVFWADEIGLTNAHGGDGVVTGDTPGAEFVGEFDGVRRRFSDRAVIETVCLKYTPADGSGGGPNWLVGDTITIDPMSLPIWPYLVNVNWTSRAPVEALFKRVRLALMMRDTNVAGIQHGYFDYSVSGLGELPQGSLTLKIEDLPFGAAGDEPLYLWIDIEYPAGAGLSETATSDFGADSLVLNNPAQMPVGDPVYYDSAYNFAIDGAHREANLEYQTKVHTITYKMGNIHYIRLPSPERILTVTELRVNGIPYVGPPLFAEDNGLWINLANYVSAPDDFLEIDVVAARPFPQNGEQVTVYYNTRSSQTVREDLLPNIITMEPKYVSEQLYILAAGSGCQDEAFPFPQQYVQAGSVFPSTAGSFSGEHEFHGLGSISISDLELDSGFARVGSTIPMVANPQELSLSRNPGDADIEGRTYYKEVIATYPPSAIAPSLKYLKKHKNILPLLAELVVDCDFGKKGQLVLVLLSRFANQDSSNAVGFVSNLAVSTTSASVYRLKGSLISRRV